MPIPEAYSKIVDALFERTKEGRLQWKEGANQWVFLTSLDKFSISLSDSDEQEDRVQYTLRVMNEEGKELDSMTLRAGDPQFAYIQDLWHEARRNALGVQDALRELEERLRAL